MDLPQHFTPGSHENLEAIFKRCDDGVSVIRGLVHPKKQIASRRRVTYGEARIKGAGNADGGGSIACQYWDRAARDGIRSGGRPVGDRADAAHVLRHRASLIILVIPLLISIFELGT